MVEYIDSATKVKIVCPEHGEFEQTPTKHLSNQGCNKCSINKRSGLCRSTLNEFIENANKTHDNEFDYSLVNYINAHTKVKIICREHGVFEQTPDAHLNRKSKCPKCVGRNKTTYEFISECAKIHNNKYDYSRTKYVNSTTKVKIICPLHGEFEQLPRLHLKGAGCKKCVNQYMDLKLFIEKSKLIHENKYDYSLSVYNGINEKLIIVCREHGEFKQTPHNHLNSNGCPKCCGKNITTEEFISKIKEIHNDKYDYSLVKYINSQTKVKILCPIHGIFEQKPPIHLMGSGCPVCGMGFTKQFKLNLLNTLSESDLLVMDPIELLTIIKQGNLPQEFLRLIDTDSESEGRIVALNELKEIFTNSDDDTEGTETILVDEDPIDDVDDEITNTSNNNSNNEDPQLPSLRDNIDNLRSLDNSLYAGMDEEAFELLVQYKLRKLWNDVLNNKVNIPDIETSEGGKYFTTIKNLFLDEYNGICDYVPPVGYNFKFQPNLMQKLTVNRLIKNKFYGNWSGTGAGKTLSFIISSREINAKLTLVIALNSTIEQTCESIKEVYPDSVTYTEYIKDFVFDTTKHNYLVLNYERFQQGYSEELYQSLTNNNQIDFVVIDEVHNAKQRDDDNESIRRGVLTRLLGRARENENLNILVMSATPVINTLFEAKSLLQLMTGLDYNELSDRRTLPNALEIFKQLTLNGLRFIPNYNINEVELTGQNLTNLNINGNHLLDELLLIPSNKYFEIERLLLPDKLNTIKQYLRKGTIIYSYFTDGIINEVKSFVEACGFSVGIYTGDVDTDYRSQIKNRFINGKIDILIGSKPIGTGVDGLQKVCNRAIMITLPWTDSEYQQFKGRIYRQGSLFESVEIIIPQVRIEIEDGQFWSWDVQRLNIIKNKRTLADACVDGLIPSKVLPKPETMFKKAQESLLKWKERIDGGKIIENSRGKLEIDLYPEIEDSELRQRTIESELSEFNRKGKIMRSENMHKEFTSNPESFFRYHALRKQRMEQWDEIPYEYIATKIKNRNQVIADFGCGENKFKDCLPNKVYSFDHVAFDESVIACDMKNVPLENETIDVAMFSLSLWGSNYEDYIKEAYRTLNYGGVIYIAEPSKSYDTPELKDELKSLLTNNGFEIVGDIENRGKFLYLKGLK